MVAAPGITSVRIFLSWCHRDQVLVKALLAELKPALALLADVAVEWWEDSHLTCGEEFTPGIVDRLEEADYGLLLLSARYFSRPFILEHELPRFATPTADTKPADKKSLPVLLNSLPGFGPGWNLRGIERQLVFTRNGRSFAEHNGVGRTLFANELADAIRRRVLGLNRYRGL